jgi:hypothetical protein
VESRDAEEPLGEYRSNLGDGPLDNLEPTHCPGLPFPESPGDRVNAQALLAMEIPEGLELFGERGPAPGAIPAQAFELRLDSPPGLHDDPRRGGPLGPESKKALEPIDEKEFLCLFDDDQRIVGVHGGVSGDIAEEFQGDPV